MLLAAAGAAAGFAMQPAATEQSAPPAPEQAATPVESIAPPPAVEAPKAPVLPKGTMVRLMVLNEVNSRDHKAGHRFVLRVDENVTVGGVTVIPVGAKGWGEVVSAEGTGGAGKSGRINARLLYVEAAGQRIAVEGERSSAGSANTGAVVASVVIWGPFGLLMKGNNAKLKAGEILNGYTVEDVAFTGPVAAQ